MLIRMLKCSRSCLEGGHKTIFYKAKIGKKEMKELRNLRRAHPTLPLS